MGFSVSNQLRSLDVRILKSLSLNLLTQVEREWFENTDILYVVLNHESVALTRHGIYPDHLWFPLRQPIHASDIPAINVDRWMWRFVSYPFPPFILWRSATCDLKKNLLHLWYVLSSHPKWLIHLLKHVHRHDQSKEVRSNLVITAISDGITYEKLA